MATLPKEIEREIARRRTFAIISHPDAGKTTLTEKLLLFGGAIQLAGEVKARGERRRARSDWMAIERERGISVSSAVMTFEHDGPRLQPARHARPPGFQRGHLSHADRGRQRGHGDRRRARHRGADPEAVRGVPAARRADHHLRQQARPREPRPVRPDRRDRADPRARRDAGELAHRHGPRFPRQLRCCSPMRCCCSSAASTDESSSRSVAAGSTTRRWRSVCRRRRVATLREEVEMARGLCPPFDLRGVPRGPPDAGVLRQRAATISACANCCAGIAELAPPPRPQPAVDAAGPRSVLPEEEAVAGFVFKVQANIDPQHRDRIAFVRLCSGHFQRGMKLKNLAHRPPDNGAEPGVLSGARAQPGRGGLARRHHRHPQSRQPADRRHADRGRRDPGHRRCPALRPRSCAGCGSRTR